jgi:diguanylate cyclase (GGDEF)-like protein
VLKLKGLSQLKLGMRERLVLSFGLALLILAAGVLWLVAQQSVGIARAYNLRELAISGRVLQDEVTQGNRRLAGSAAVLVADFAFRTAVGSGDHDTIASVLLNHGERIKASLTLLLDLAGKLSVDPLPSQQPRHMAPLQGLVKVAQTEGWAGALMMLDGHAYQMAVVPVLAPDPVAWVVTGMQIDAALAKHLQTLLGCEVSFLRQLTNGEWQTLASSKPAEAQAVLLQGLARHPANPSSARWAAAVEPAFESYLIPLETIGPQTVMVVLQRSMNGAAEIFEPLLSTLAFTMVVGVLLCLLVGAGLAQQITGPLKKLANIANRMRIGDYTTPMGEFPPDEIGMFAATFSHMREDIAARETHIRRIAFEDPLTSLANRAGLVKRLDELCALGVPLSVLLIDLHRFQVINNTLGPDAGDEVLQLVANRLKGLLKESAIVARTHADVFSMVIHSDCPALLAGIVDQLQDVLGQRVVIDGQEVDITACIAAARFPADGPDALTLLRKADAAMSYAKKAQLVFTLYDSMLDKYQPETLHLLGDLQRAVEGGDLLLMYQPKVTLATGAVASVEALVRWRHPERGLIPPIDFLPFAEKTGAIKIITRWVIKEAMAQIERWQALGQCLQVAINVSARDLAGHELVECLSNALVEFRVSPSSVCIEITESAMMENSELAYATVARLRNLGVSIAIDDYGTGYSSLAYIKDLQAAELKIDRAFVKDIEQRAEDQVIVRSTIELGHNLGMRVVAEGVETLTQLGILKRLGCDSAQGFLISRPLPSEALLAWLAAFQWHDLDGEKLALVSDGAATIAVKT